jgi:pyruvate dehydrogenase E1 component
MPAEDPRSAGPPRTARRSSTSGSAAASSAACCPQRFGARVSRPPAGDALFRSSEGHDGDRETGRHHHGHRADAGANCWATGTSAKLIVPIVPDEARTFGMEALFRNYGIYAHAGQLYEPVDANLLMRTTRSAKNGQILEEGITEAGSMASFIAAGTAYSTHGHQHDPVLPLLLDVRLSAHRATASGPPATCARGFLLGATAGRTTLAGEGLQHQDGHSHMLAYGYPSVKAYDPAFAYEVAVIVQDGLRRMLEDGQHVIYYLTVTNEFYKMPPKPEGVDEGILKGLYRFRASPRRRARTKAHLLGSGAILNEVLAAQEILENDFGVAADVWSATSYKALYQDAVATARWNRMHPDERPRSAYIERQLGREKGVFVAASDYLMALPASIAKWVPGPMHLLGTDGYGRSDTREALRDFFEVDARHIAYAALDGLAREGQIKATVLNKARRQLEINPEKANPFND